MIKTSALFDRIGTFSETAVGSEEEMVIWRIITKGRKETNDNMLVSSNSSRTLTLCVLVFATKLIFDRISSGL